MFADDCVLYMSAAGNNWDVIKLKLQQDLNTFVKWSTENAFTLNISKTKTVIFGNRHKLSKLKMPDQLYIYGKMLDFVLIIWTSH